MTRLCFLCGKKIGFLRSLTDQRYCSAAHRQEARLASSQVMREEEEVESWSVEKSRNRRQSAAGNSGPSTGHAASIFAFVLVAGLLILALTLPGPSSSTSYGPSVSLDPGVKQGMWDRASSALSELIRSSAPVTLHQDFHSGFSGWDTLTVRSTAEDAKNWLSSGSTPETGRPGALRLWSRSVPLQNYQMEFQGRIEAHSLNWAFRATDQNNYYASRLVITKSGAQPNASLLRYVVMNGKEFERTTSPLPLTIEKGVDYRVRMSIQDDRFLTYLNGQIIGDWSDRRLHRGGVGFLVDQEDPQEVAWVDISERDSFLGRMLAHFSLFVMPPGVSR